MDQTRTTESVLIAVGICEPDVELAKADIVARIHRLIESRRCSPEEVATVLGVAASELQTLLQGRLATCSLDQLLRMLTWLGDDVDVTIRPRLQRTKRGVLRVLQATAVENPDDFEAVRVARDKPASSANFAETTRPNASDERANRGVNTSVTASRDDRQLLDRRAVEKMTSLDITTIYRKMSAGTFPQPVRVGRRRVAWRASEIVQWQQDLEVGTQTARWRVLRSRERDPSPGGKPRRGRG